MLLLLVFGCETPPPKEPLNYSEDARKAYENANELVEQHQWIEAEAHMKEVLRRFRYSKYARLAELRLGDIAFEQEKYSEALALYRKFVETHQTMEKEVVYARSRIAESEYRQVPDSAFFSAAEEREAGPALDAFREAKSFLQDHPNAPESKRVREMLTDVTDKLILHELFVARYYASRDNFEAAVLRIKYALSNFGASAPRGGANLTGSREPEALIVLGETYLKMHKWAEARRAFLDVLDRFGSSGYAIQAQGHLARLDTSVTR